jgi:hypothetical protein
MRRAFRSEWVKFLRPGQLLGSWGTMAGFAVVLTSILVLNASDAVQEPRQPQPGDRGGPVIPVSLLEAPAGIVFTFQAAGQLLGIIALVIAAANLATEYTAGTLKVLLVRAPRRGFLAAGKIAAVASFVAVGVALTLAVSVALSVALAGARGIDTGAWWTMDGLAAVGKAFANITLASWAWGLMGTMLAALFRSGFPAIGVGIAYPLVVEGLLGLALPDVVKWMPGAALGAFTAGDAASALGSPPGLDYATAAALVAAYSAVFLAVPVALIVRRDVA